MGVSNKAVSKWENGESLPKTSTMLKLAEIFDININELIGLTYSAPIEPNNTEEINRLISENAALSSKLNEIDRRKKRGFISVLIICVVGIIVSVVVALCATADKGMNSEIKDAGQNNTSIVFAEKTFVPSSTLEEYIFSNEDEYCCSLETKYAVYKDSSGRDHKVVIDCSCYTDYVILQVGKKDYFYSESKLNTDWFNIENIDSLSFTRKSITYNYDDYYDYDDYDDYEDYKYYYSDEYADIDVINCFCAFYNYKGDPIDKGITQRFMGEKAYTVSIDFNNFSFGYTDIDFGEFFKDDKGNVYFYDYITANAYSVGKELSNFVYENKKT